jgi:hypothetical protein
MYNYLLGDYPPPWSSNYIGGVYVMNAQLTSLSACLANEIMGSTGIV